jgi:hypothetical protein
MLVDIDSVHMELAIVSGGKLLFSRYFKADPTAPDWENVLVSEVTKSRDAYVKEVVGGQLPEKVFVMGEEASCGAVAAILNGRGDFKAEVLAQKKINTDTSFSSLIGLGLAEVPYSLNLLPQDLKEGLLRHKRKQEYMPLARLGLAITVVFGLSMLIGLANKTRYLKKLKAELDKISQEARPLREIERRMNIASSAKNDSPSCLEAFSEIHRLIPPSVTLADFIYETGSQMVLRGQAQDLESVFSLAPKIAGSKIFSRFLVKVRYATKRKTASGETIGFEIVCARK